MEIKINKFANIKIKIKKFAKWFLIGILGVLLIAGIVYALLHYKVVKIPYVTDKLAAIAQKLPFITQSTKSTPQALQETELQKVKKENDTLKKSIADKNYEMTTLQKNIDDMDNKQKVLQKSTDDAKAEIIKLNEKMLAGNKTDGDSKTSQQSVYKNMAQYFAEMNTKEAADLISKLNDQDIIGVLSALDTALAAEILQKMPRDKATLVTKKMLVSTPQ